MRNGVRAVVVVVVTATELFATDTEPGDLAVAGGNWAILVAILHCTHTHRRLLIIMLAETEKRGAI